MFHRKRASSNPVSPPLQLDPPDKISCADALLTTSPQPRVVKTPPSAAASLAATQAFLANRASSANLSNAAAAAALRSHTTTPTPVGHVQTKRMQRRGSTSSNGSAPNRPGLQRRGSSGSLTERTFRDTASPVPKRPASAQGPYTRYDDPPPVPALPKSYASPSLAPRMGPQRPASVEPPERVSSPPPRLPGGRGASLDRGPEHFTSNKGGQKPRISSLDTVGEIERAGSRSSINFSRPMSPQNSSPTSPLASGRVKSHPTTQPTGVSGLADAVVNRATDSIQQPATAPVKKKKKIVGKNAAEGSQLALGTTSVPQGNNLRTTPQQQSTVGIPTPPASENGSSPGGSNEAPKPKKKKKTTSVTGSQAQEVGEGFGNSYPSDTDSVSSELSSTTDRARNYNTRAAGLLIKQPSIVREDREAEEQEDRRVPSKSKNGQAGQNGAIGAMTSANTSRVVAKDRQHYRTVSQSEASRGPKRTSLDVPGGGRPGSLSPVRAAHFSSQPEYETPDGVRHQPPARSVSPAKSALKSSPSRGQSPTIGRPTGRRASLAPGEASDTASNISEEGSRLGLKKKKSVRVSFEDDSINDGRTESPPMSSDSPVFASQQNKPKGRSWFDLVRDKNQEGAVIDTDQDSVIKPMPTLPSFGSIRGRPDDSILEATKEQNPSDDWAKDTLRGMDTSTDQIIGGVIAQNAAAKANTGDAQTTPQDDPTAPLPPQVTSVEGSGYHSDDEAGLDRDERVIAEKRSKDPRTDVPSIELQPATPALELSGQSKEWLGMPGGFPGSSEGTESKTFSLTSTITGNEHASPAITPATIGIAEPEPEAAAQLHEPGAPHVGEVAEGLRSQIDAQSGEESDDTGVSIYSDAAEDPDDLDGDGFGSINAIVESPATPIVPLMARSPPTSPTVKPPDEKSPVEKVPSPNNPTRGPLARNESELSEPGSDEGWDRAQAYWSGLSHTKKLQLERAALPGAIDEPVLPNKTMRGPDSVKKKKKVPKKKIPPPDSNQTATPGIVKSASPQALPLKSSMRKSQAEPMQESQMRTSMRDGPPAKSGLKKSAQRTSMAPPTEPKGTLQKKTRPVSAVAMVDYNKPQIAHARAASALGTSTSLTPVAPQAKERKSVIRPSVFRNDSDSSSSFKKSRPATPSAGKYTMKRTMRPSGVDARPQSPPVTGQTSSSATARRPFSSVGPGTGGGGMRTSMRGSIDSGKPARTSLRDSVDSKRPKSPSRFGFGKSKTKPVEAKPISRFSSRFGGSSDDEDYRPPPRSRFADSSDEDEPAGLTPVRGIPRRTDEGDSTDLEDSSIENVPSSPKAKVNGTKPAVNTKPEGAALATGSLRVPSGDSPTTTMGTGLQAKKAAEKENKKRSFFGVLGSRKKSDDPTRVRKSDADSAARRDTPLERSKAERKLSAGPTNTNDRVLAPSSPTTSPVSQLTRPNLGSRSSTAASSPKTPKLQRRNTPKQTTTANDISWPLPQGAGGVQSAPDSRPQTSNGPGASGGTERPNVGRVQSEIGPPRTAPLVVGKAEKKKRFGALRKAFGLHD